MTCWREYQVPGGVRRTFMGSSRVWGHSRLRGCQSGTVDSELSWNIFWAIRDALDEILFQIWLCALAAESL